MSHYDIAPIPTTYAGVDFRSRMEADFAAWCDENGTEWEYEPRTYVCRCHRQRYRPDFLLNGRVLVELKPTEEMADEVIATDRMHPAAVNRPDLTLTVAWPQSWSGSGYEGWVGIDILPAERAEPDWRQSEREWGVRIVRNGQIESVRSVLRRVYDLLEQAYERRQAS